MKLSYWVADEKAASGQKCQYYVATQPVVKFELQRSIIVKLGKTVS